MSVIKDEAGQGKLHESGNVDVTGDVTGDVTEDAPAEVDEDVANDVPAETGQPPEKQGKREGSGLSTFLLAALPILISVLSAYYAYSQVQVGKAQNQAAAEQQLMTVVTEIATLNGSDSTTTQLALSIAARNQQLTYGQAGQALISSLPPSDITATDYVQVGKALEAGGDYASALALYNAVAPNPQDPDSFANAKRNAALLWYQLAENPGLSAAARNADEASARSDMISAGDAYAKSKYVYLNDEVESIALTYFEDAGYQATINCATARGDMRAADSALSHDIGMTQNAQIKDFTGIANAQLDARCAG
jgi:hypothetical protein